MIFKTTLKEPWLLLCRVKTFFKENFFSESRAALSWHESTMPPAPAIPPKELTKIHQELLADASVIHPEDWK